MAICGDDEVDDPTNDCCGDGYYDDGEECDLGASMNGAANSGCNDDCTIDTTFYPDSFQCVL